MWGDRIDVKIKEIGTSYLDSNINELTCTKEYKLLEEEFKKGTIDNQRETIKSLLGSEHKKIMGQVVVKLLKEIKIENYTQLMDVFSGINKMLTPDIMNDLLIDGKLIMMERNIKITIATMTISVVSIVAITAAYNSIREKTLLIASILIGMIDLASILALIGNIKEYKKEVQKIRRANK